MPSFFVTATDTAAGKTTASLAMLRSARRRGLKVACMKPVESGVSGGGGDAEALAEAAGVPAGDVAVYRLADPVAPGVAAARAGVDLDFAPIWERLRLLEAGHPDLLLVEGAGGLLVPLGGGRMIADLVGELGLPLLVVARDALGTINHTLLTVEAALARGLTVAGVILCQTEAARDGEDNLVEIERGLAGAAPVLGIVPHLLDRSAEALADAGDPILARLLEADG